MQPIQSRRLIGELMVERRLINERQLKSALRYQAKASSGSGSACSTKKLIGEALVDLGYLEEETLYRFLSSFFYGCKVPIDVNKKIRIIKDVSDLATADFKKWLIFMVKKGATDLHLVTGSPPQLRLRGELVPAKIGPVSSEQIKNLVYSILTIDEIETFEQNKTLDKSIEIEEISRYRINLHWQRDSIGVSVRALPLRIPAFEELGVPKILKDFISKPSGLVLVSGPAGCGKSTTLASAIEWVNLTKNAHVITVEDPIEYAFKSKKSLIRQRELGKDTLSFDEALKSVVRQDPNIILIGEMRDLDTIKTALALAETGHLVLSTLHTQDAAHAINRIIDVFPPAHQHEIRIKLSLVLQGVIVQQLIPRVDNPNRVLACEILNCVPAVRNLIRENNLAQIRSAIQTGSQFGMLSMNQSLIDLVEREIIFWEEAYARSNDREELMRLLPRPQ